MTESEPVETVDAEPEHRYLGEISALWTQRFATAIGDRNPLYYDEDYARSHGYPGIIAPPTYLAAVIGWDAGPPQDKLLADGNDPASVLPELKGKRLMGGGQELTFLKPVCPGERVSATRRVVERLSRMTSVGQATFVVSETRYLDRDGEALLIARETIIAVD